MSPANSSWKRGLYFVTPGGLDDDRLRALTRNVIAGGAVMVQYRCKHADSARRRQQASELLHIAHASGVPLIINDDVSLARDIGADGVHLGRDDGDVADARRTLGAAAIIGVSCYASLDRAQEAAAQGASYLAFGAMHPSPTKPAAPRADAAILSACAGLGLPRVAIGGITPDNAPALLAAGADLLAVISAFDSSADADARALAARFAALFTDSGTPS